MAKKKDYSKWNKTELMREIKKLEKRKKYGIVWGGIAIFVNGTWRYNNKEKYEYNPNNFSEWKVLKF